MVLLEELILEMKIANYARISKRLDQTVENQVPILEQWCSKSGHSFDTFVEEESTRKTRPVKDKIIRDLRQGLYDGMACVRLDRFLRDMSEVSVIKELVDKGRAFFFISDGLEFNPKTTNAFGRFQIHILAAFAEFERDINRERTLDGLERAKSQGKVLGRPKGSKDKKKRRTAGYLLRWKKVK